MVFLAEKLDLSSLPTREVPKFNSWREYACSKFCNVVFSKSLHEKLKESGVTCYALHPGLSLNGDNLNNLLDSNHCGIKFYPFDR